MFTVAIIGPDGSGKTTLARSLEQSLPIRARYLYMGVNLEASNRALPTTRLVLWIKKMRGQPGDLTGPRYDDGDPSIKKRGWLKSIKGTFRTLNQIAEVSYRQAIIRWHMSRGYVVLADRDFFADYYATDIDPQLPHRSWNRRLHGWVLQRLYRRPDLVLCLDAPPELMWNRKREGGVDYLSRRRRDYLRLADVLPNFRLIDASHSVARVHADAEAEILNYYNTRIEPLRAKAS